MKTEDGDPRVDRLRVAGYDPERMTHAEVVEAIGRGVLPVEPGAQIPQEEFVERPDPMKVDLADLREALGDEIGYVRLGTDVRFISPRTPCPHPRVLRPCERPAPSRVSRLAPSAIAALIGFCAGADPSFEAFNRDRGRGRK